MANVFLRHSAARPALCPLLAFILTALLSGLFSTACQPPAQQSASPAPASTAAPVEIPGRIVGSVTLENEKNAGGIQVYVPGTQHVAVTDDQGRFSLDNMPPGPYRVMARADAHESKQLGEVTVEHSLILKEYSLSSATLALKSPGSSASLSSALGSLSGKVTTAPGVPSPDFSRCVVQLQGSPYRTLCSSDGTFFLWSLPADDYKLQVAMEGLEMFATTVRVLPGRQTSAPPIELKPTSALPASAAAPPPSGTRRIFGTVELTTAAGAPSNAFDKITVGIVGQPTLVSHLGPDGSFSLDKLAAAKYSVAAWGDGFDRSSPLEVDLTDEPEFEIQLTLNASGATSNTATAGTATLHGVALKNKDGLSDMSGISVALAGTSRVAITDSEGKYTISGVAPGAYQVVAQASGFKSAQLGPLTVADGADVEVGGLMLEPDLAYPTVLATTPAEGARNIMIRREIPITVRFSKKMTPESLRQAVHIEPPVAFRIYAGNESPDTDFDLMKIVLVGTGAAPVAAFDTRYKITIGTAAHDFEGLALQKPYDLTFRTGLPSVIGSFPEQNGVLQEFTPGRPIVIYFNAPMDHASLTAESVRIQSTSTLTPSIALNDDADSGWTSMSISTTWAPDQKYQVVLQRRARTVSKNPLSNTPYTLNFRTATRVPIKLPTLRDNGPR